jgi:putative oxidoreductase
MLKKIIHKNADALLLIARIIIGGIFIYSGWAKIEMMEQTVGYFASMGIPAFLTYVVAYGELVGGALLVIGLWSEYSIAFLSVIMIVAIYYTRSMGMQGFGFPLSVLGGLIAIAAHGTGKYSVHSVKIS